MYLHPSEDKTHGYNLGSKEGESFVYGFEVYQMRADVLVEIGMVYVFVGSGRLN